jgi:hypothetical protein
MLGVMSDNYILGAMVRDYRYKVIIGIIGGKVIRFMF